ncbi:cation:proton antiporter [Latilactobacillus curvatus]|uniref:Cation:proton antiporter n=1 Tax=Latilactobacillus curvatus TaxID=28038 RepID=A0A385ABV2_LATCU|nr:cation:proton antiporter [Latilactobacillus curvatus]AOO74791.1 sodium:proton antiporter [Latilactobacillus curvatus]ASN61316.1 cation:proton antiporter [Latilactobacillus curvatus]AXN35104.1 cation:proton antiporter [Latilactobacillus curvatus]AZP97110.1 cation:proton antiporter [Latilactobacillus curvatus]EHE85728.1 sodium/hydrogen exchanger family protein [Latilactobacillus curvatus CRL 705]
MATLAIILISTLLAGHMSKRIGMPAVIGQLLVGIILGPALFGVLHENSFIHTFSEIGVVLLMFIAGLESNLTLLKKYFKPSLVVAVLGVIVPMISMYGMSLAFGISQLESLFIGVIFAATSVSISVEVLRELNVLESKEGTIILGAAVVDDLLAVIILSVLTSLFGAQLAAASSTHMSLGLSLLLQALFMVAVYFSVKWIVPFVMHLSRRLLVPYASAITSLIICFGFVWFAEAVELSAVVGAFFAGIAISQTPYKEEINRHIEPIGYTVFIPVFFVSIGLSMNLASLNQHILFITILTVLAVFSKLIGSGLGARWMNNSPQGAYTIGAAMISRGEMALIIAQIGYNAKLLSELYYSEIIFVIIITTVLAPLILKHAVKRQLATEIN